MQVDIRPASATQLSNFIATVNNVKTIDLTWTLPVSDSTYRAAQVWVNTVNDVDTATLVATVAGNYYSYTAADTNGRYFWIRTINQYDRADGPFTGPAQATPKLLVTSDIGVFDLATANIINQLAVGKITGLGALATLNAVNASTQVTNLGGLAFANQIYANDIGAGQLAAGVVYAGTINASQVNAGTFTGLTFRTASSGQRIVIDGASNTLQVYNSAGSNVASLGNGGGNLSASAYSTIPAIFATGGGSAAAIQTSGNIIQSSGDATLGQVNPSSSNSYSLGDSGHIWTTAYLNSAPVVTSDRRTKTDIEDVPLGLNFIMSLRPVQYKQAVAENVVEVTQVKPTRGNPYPAATVSTTPRAGARYHYGLISQEVKEALNAAGVDAGIWTLADPADENSAQALRYEELIAPLIKAVQELTMRVAQLEKTVDL